MEQKLAIDPLIFRGILSRNVVWPLVVGLLSALFFFAIVMYLLSISRWVENTDLIIREANDVLKLCLDRETGLRGYVITGNREFLEPYERARNNIQPKLDELKHLLRDDAEQLHRIDNIEKLATRWFDYAKEVVALRADDRDAAAMVRAGTGKRIMDDLRGEFSNFIIGEEQIKSARNNSAKNTVYTLGAVFLLFSLLFAGLLAYLGRRDLRYLSNTYSDVLRQQIGHVEILQRQAWLRDGQSQMADRVIGQLSLTTLCSNILHFLTEYLDAKIGAVYVVGVDGSLIRAAGYALSEESEKHRQRLRFGESLVGQAALEGRLLQMHQLPKDYFKINSALGSTLPSSLLILPVFADKEINAVIELGFTHATTAREFELLQQLGDNIGTAIAAANYRLRLQAALGATQQLNEELQAQQEELRVVNGELEEQARALEESQSHLENQQAELRQTNEQLEQQAVELELQRDIVQQKNSALTHAQHQLEQRAAELESASRYKSEFLANMSHELRTPLNSSLILAKLLADNSEGNLNAEQIKFANSIYDADNELLDLINDILDISKVEAGKLEIRADNLSLAKVIAGLETAFRPLAANKALRFDIRVAADLPNTIFSDEKRIAQILKNLLSNAIKFTKQFGTVELLASLHSPDEIAIAVKDSGIGIEMEFQQDIFEAFRQGDGGTNRKYGGTGLGLSISRNLARLLGGSISLHSEPGVGSEFTLLIPRVYREAQPERRGQRYREPVEITVPKTAPPELVAKQALVDDDRAHLSDTARTILIIEDEPRFAEILYDLAHQQHFNCLLASAADEGFETAVKYLPDAILLDMKLPDYSGLTVLERLKSNSKTRHIPVHIISVEDYSETALLMGAVGYLTKPATHAALKATLVKIEEKIDQKLKHVLLVEDDPVQRESIEKLIGDDDIEIVGVESGELALQQLHRKTFDCMIIDLKLPDMNGGELLRRMTDEGIGSFPPVIVYTARNLSFEEEAELLRYSRSIIIKGARSPERLLDEVMLFLHKVEANLSVDRQRMLKISRNRERDFEGRKILVVDDDVRNIFALTSALEQKGAVVEVGRNGREALEKLHRDPSIELVLMDIMMPEMDGYEAIRKIRESPSFSRLPIIAVTAKAMRDDHENCLRAGANDYLAKPIDIDRLLSLIRVWMPHLQRL